MSAIDKLELKLASMEKDGDEANEPKPEGSPADKSHDIAEAVAALEAAVATVKETLAELSK